MNKYYYMTNDCCYAIDFYANSMKEARQRVRERLDKKTLHGVEVWQA